MLRNCKRLLLLSFIFFILIMPNIVLASEPEPAIKVFINDKELQMDVEPIIADGRTLVPFRALFETLGLNVEWTGYSQSITAQSKTRSGSIVKYIRLRVGNTEAYISNYGKKTTLDTPPIIKNDRTLVPLRFVAEALDMNVKWDEASRTVIITNKDLRIDEKGFIVESNGTSVIKSDIEFLEVADYAKDSKNFLALGEDKMLYVVDKSDLSYRLISLNKNNEISAFNVIYYNQKFYYKDTSISSKEPVIKMTDGVKEREFSPISSNFFAIKNRLYFSNLYGYGLDKVNNKYNPQYQYIDMDSDKEITITSGGNTRLLYASEDEVFYVDYIEKDINNEIYFEENFYLITWVGENRLECKIILTLKEDNIGKEYHLNKDSVKDNKYIRPDLIVTGDNLALYKSKNGIFLIDTKEKTIKNISSIVASHAYYKDNKLYIVNGNEIGYIDLNSYNYSKVFSKADIISKDRVVLIDDVDSEGNITFESKQEVEYKRYDIYVYKYLLKENKLKFISYTPGKSGDYDKEKINKLSQSLIEVDK